MRILPLFLLLAAYSAPAFAQNLVLNGSFEAGAEGWTFTGGLSIVGPPDVPPSVGVDGSRVASLGGGDIPNSTLSQTFPVGSGTDYLLTLATAAFGDNFPGRFGSVLVEMLAPDSSVLASQSFASVSPGPSIGTNGFTRHTLQFRTPMNAASVTLRITDTSPSGGVAVDIMIDDVRVFNQPLPSGSNLVVNGGFEAPELLAGHVHLPADALAPWQTTDESFELWLSGSFLESPDGLQHLEILSVSPSATVSQMVATIPGEDYVLSFYHSPRPGVDSTLTVGINSDPVAVFSENGAPLSAFQWQRFRTNFTATSNATTISFSDSAPTAAGTHLDAVTLRQLPLRSMLRVSEVELCFESVATKAYQIQSRSALAANLWTNFGDPIQGNGATYCITNTVPAGEAQRFYRVLTVP